LAEPALEVAVQWPQILGIGCETIEAMLQDVKFSLQLWLCCW